MCFPSQKPHPLPSQPELFSGSDRSAHRSEPSLTQKGEPSFFFFFFHLFCPEPGCALSSRLPSSFSGALPLLPWGCLLAVPLLEHTGLIQTSWFLASWSPSPSSGMLPRFTACLPCGFSFKHILKWPQLMDTVNWRSPGPESELGQMAGGVASLPVALNLPFNTVPQLW